MSEEVSVKVIEIIQRNYNVKSFRFQRPEAFDYQAGQFLLVNLGADAGLKKYLSFSSSPTENGYLEFTKKLTGSDFSQALEALKVGDEVAIKYPFGKFVLDTSFSKIAFLSGGIGITPILSICKYVVDKNSGNDLALIYANRSIKDVVFKDDFDALAQRYAALKVTQVLSEAEPGFIGRVGRINAEMIKQEIPDYAQRKFYLCGPPQMVEAMRKILAEELNLAQDKIITENFQGY